MAMVKVHPGGIKQVFSLFRQHESQPRALGDSKRSTAICTEFLLSPATRFILSLSTLRLRSGTSLLRRIVSEVGTSPGLSRGMVGSDQGKEK